MNIAYEAFNEVLTMKEGDIYRITIENSLLFRKLIEELLEDINGDSEHIILSENNQKLNCKKISEIIINPFALDINSKKVLQKLYAELQQISLEAEHYEKSLELRESINRFILDICFHSKYILNHNLNFELKDIFAAVKIHLEEENFNLLEKLLAYIRTSHLFLGVQVFWIINISDYFTVD